MKVRRSGVLVPLFSLASSRSWGIGEFLDLPEFAKWLRAAGQAFVQILPITELPESQSSPYSALTAMALDPNFIALPALEDFEGLGGEAQLPEEDRQALDALRKTERVMYGDVRSLKGRVLRRAYRRFVEHEVAHGSRRAEEFRAFVHEHAGWLDDYAIFRALHARHAGTPWWDWPAPLAQRVEPVLESTVGELREEIDYRKYLQWIAATQWNQARHDASPVQVFGDVPFMISADSPDVWTRQNEFRFDGTVGVPPDAFSETGQDWGLPPWRWDVMAENDFTWMRRRAERTARLFDGFRLDHLVGLYRTYIRPLDKFVPPFFAPADEPTQAKLGEKLVSLYRDTGAEVIAEDLGTVPDFVRESLRRLGVPGFKVVRWERRWKARGKPFIDPTEYDEASVATTGTHDTEPLAAWWSAAPARERRAVLRMPSMKRLRTDSASELDVLLRALLHAPSRLTIIPLQDVFGWTDRINTPAQITADNWSWMLRWPVDRLLDIPEARERAAVLARWTRESDR
ncbi:MAG TPA: 4-alpha-glucanotransferase [Vicinamibacterales bacterium]|nr:4-alpha-glucanotransferase [Vicinamibacterales bacterium]